MRSTLIGTALLLLSLAPALPAGAQAQRDSARARAEQQRERERERRARERERARQMRDEDEEDRGSRQGGRASIDTTVAFNRGGVVDLSLPSGDIKVVGWSRNEVRVQAETDEGELRFEASPARISLDVERHGRRGGRHGAEARYQLSVPEGTRVLMQSTSGDLSARGVKGEVEARTVSGDVAIEDAARRITLESVSGDVRATRLTGDVRAHSVSGGVELAGVEGDVDAESVSGSISVRDARSKVTRFETVSGDVTYAGSVDAAGRYEFHSHSGTVRLVVPAGTNASLSLETFSGEIESDFPLTLRPDPSAGDDDRRGRRPRRMDFTLGSGGPRVNAETFSGDIVIQRTGR